MEKYIKIDNHTVKIEVTKVEEVLIDLEQLEYDKDSLIRTMQANLDEVNQKNAGIQTMIDKIDQKITEIKKLGVKKRDVNDKSVIEPQTEDLPLEQEVEVEVSIK